jgi:hypothetical protein
VQRDPDLTLFLAEDPDQFADACELIREDEELELVAVVAIAQDARDPRVPTERLLLIFGTSPPDGDRRAT